MGFRKIERFWFLFGLRKYRRLEAENWVLGFEGNLGGLKMDEF